MRIAFGASELELRTWDRKDDLQAYLEQLEASYVLLGQDAQVETAFYSVTLHLPGAGDRRLGYGVISEGHGLVPQLLLQDPELGLMLGFNRDVVGVDGGAPRVRFHRRLDALFWAFLPTDSPDMIVVIHEIGATALGSDGREFWQYSKDLLTDYAIVGDELRLTFADAPPVSLALASGILRQT